MKKSTAALLLAVFAAIAIVAPVAQGTGGADRIKALESKVKALQTRVASLEAGTASTRTELTSLTGCMRYRVLPISQYDGYVYTANGQPGVTTALDITETGQTPGAYAAIVNPTCVGAHSALRLSSRGHTAAGLHLR